MIKARSVTIRGNKGVDLQEIQDKKHNLFIGISLSNKVFTPENIRSLILFCLENTKDKVLVWVPGRMHATNYRYFNGMSRADALQKAYKDEDDCMKIIQDIISELPEDLGRKIVLANYDDICTPKYIRQRDVFFRTFAEKGNFYEDVIEIVNEVICSRNRVPSKEKAESLALYVLSELPLFVDGVQKNGDDAVYTVVPYPGFGKIDDLAMGIVEGKKFPELTSKLGLTNKVGILDVDFE